MTVLLVEDERSNRIVIQQNLSLRGIETACACNGQEALDWLAQNKKPTAIILDIRMPVMDGITFLSRYTDDVPVILISGYGFDETLPRPIHAVIPKPIDMSALVATLRALEV